MSNWGWSDRAMNNFFLLFFISRSFDFDWTKTNNDDFFYISFVACESHNKRTSEFEWGVICTKIFFWLLVLGLETKNAMN